MQLVMSCINEGERSTASELSELGEPLWVLAELHHVAPSKLRPPIRVVAKPLSQFGTGRDLLEPKVDRGILLLHSPGPKPIHQNTRPVTGGRLLVDTFQSDFVCRNSLRHNPCPQFRAHASFGGFPSPRQQRAVTSREHRKPRTAQRLRKAAWSELARVMIASKRHRANRSQSPCMMPAMIGTT